MHPWLHFVRCTLAANASAAAAAPEKCRYGHYAVRYTEVLLRTKNEPHKNLEHWRLQLEPRKEHRAYEHSTVHKQFLLAPAVLSNVHKMLCQS